MNGKLLIYGASGYSGQLISQHALASGLDFEVAGRDADRTRALAGKLGVGSRSFSLEDADGIRRGLEGVQCILHCAGPFSRTARQVMDACIERKVHYLDITAEFGVFALAESKSEAARAAGIMLLPGVGWDVVPSDCLAVHTVRRVPRPRQLRIALKHFGGISRGSALSAAEMLELGALRRVEGRIVSSAEPARRTFDFGAGPGIRPGSASASR